jgi:hypothetical protein
MKFYFNLEVGFLNRSSVRSQLNNSKLKLKHWYPGCRVLITENKTFFDSSFYFEVDNLPDDSKSHMEQWLDQMKNIASQWN